MDFILSHVQMTWKERARAFAEEQIAPQLELLETDQNRRRELFVLMGREGYFTLGIPHPDGSSDTIAYLMALREIARIDAGIGVAMAVTNMVADEIFKRGSVEQKSKYLSALRNGSGAPAAFALTEKNAGSDAKAVQTQALKNEEGSGYILVGEKKMITNADTAAVILVIARTDKDPKKGLSAFLLDHGTPGFAIFKRESKLGLLTANLVSIRFDNCQLPKEKLLGELGGGLKIALSALDGGRLGVAAQALGIADAAFEAARSYAIQREQFGGPIAQQQAIAFKLADMQMQLSAGELLLLKAAWLRDQGLPYTREASEAKLYCSEAANRIADEGLQIHGGWGYTKEYAAEKYFRDARVTTLYEGTSEIQRLVIAKHLLNEQSASS